MAKAHKRANLEFDAEELDRIDEAARAVGMSRAAWVKKACRELLARQTRQQRRGRQPTS